MGMVETIERQITKEEFRRLYVRYGQSKPDTGWTQDYYDHFYKNETGAKYFFTEPSSPDQNMMWISDGSDVKRIFLLSEKATESFFDFPGKD